MVLTDRDVDLLESVADFEVLTREQIAKHLLFGSVTRVNAVLLRLVRHRYVVPRRQPSVRGTRRLVYSLGPAGIEVLQGHEGKSSPATPRRWKERSDLFVEHQIRLNDVRLAFTHLDCDGFRLLRWRSDHELRNLHLGLVPDAFVEYEIAGASFAAFLEVDLGTESMSRWTDKVKGYSTLAFSGRFREIFSRQYFRVLVITTSMRRLTSIDKTIAAQTDRIFRMTTFDQLAADGPLAVIWKPPATSSPTSLTD